MIESQPRQDGRNMTMVLHPTKKDGKKEKPERTPKAEKVPTVPIAEASVDDVPPPQDNGAT